VVLEGVEGEAGRMKKIKIRVKTNSRKQRVVIKENVIYVDLISIPEQGKANNELLGLLAKELGYKKRKISILTGLKSRDKMIGIIDD
jgi:uncharacterized protein YggU (UPF0235/DUF167 family)